MSKPQRISAVVTLAVVAAVLFWSFAGSSVLYRMQHPVATGLFADLNPSPWALDALTQVIPGVVLPLLMLGAAAVIISGSSSPAR